MLLALWTVQFRVSIFKNKSILAIWGRTPRHVFLLFHCLIEGKVIVFLQFAVLKYQFNIFNAHLGLAPISRALEWEPTILQLISEVRL